MCAAPRLPDEVWAGILGYLPKLRELCTLSIVSRGWQLRVFPHLYHTVYLTYASHLKQLSERFTTDGDPALSVREHLRGLVLDNDESRFSKGDFILDENIGSLATILSAATNLQRFAWKLQFVPSDPDAIKLLQTSCPNLRSFEFVGRGNIADFSEDRYARIFDLKNLEHISLSIRQTQPLFLPNLEQFALPLRSSPHLKFMEINLEDIFDENKFYWSPSALFATLEGVTFPFLHTFRAHGAVDVDWFHSFNTPSTDPLGDFFTRHPGIRTIGFGWMEEVDHHVVVAPQVVEALFPSLTHFDAPAFLCGAVMASRLAGQLEYLGIWDVLSAHGPNLQTIPQTAKQMPRLRKLQIDCSRTGRVSMDAVKKILSCTPGLEEFEVSRRVDQPVCTFQIMKINPNGGTLPGRTTRGVTTGAQPTNPAV
ncbi:hypothetical protein FRC06_001808 [Ceratobasidium sp. 370]|nr:hypothetical protein FRC06_001808 [Ceratobasidium sp. 370]